MRDRRRGSRVVQPGARQRLDSRHRFAPEQLCVPGNPNLTRPLDLWDPTIKRLDELAERGHNAGRCRDTAKTFVDHYQRLSGIVGRHCSREHTWDFVQIDGFQRVDPLIEFRG